MKKIIVMFMLMLFLVGCDGGVQHVIIFNFPKIKTKDSKEIVEYVVRTMQFDVKHKIEVDYKTLSTYEYSKEGVKGEFILVDCKIKDKKYFIQIRIFNNISNFHASLTEK